MGRMYAIHFNDVAVTAAQDLFEIVNPADSVMILHEFEITQSSDAGDAASEQLKVSVKKGIGSTSGSGGSAATVSKIQTGDAAAGITAEVNNTSQAVAGGGSLTRLLAMAGHVQAGIHHLPTPECRLVFSPSEVCIISLDAAPTDSLTMSGYAIVEEIGG